jgi:hypothetical protein
MDNLPAPGLYRTTKAYPSNEEAFPANVLVYVGQKEDGSVFVVRPGDNRLNRWYWGEPTMPLRSVIWAQTLKPLPGEGYYTLPEDVRVGEGGAWLKNAIVQLGYNAAGQGIIFVAEQHAKDTRNVLAFADSGVLIDDNLLSRLVWVPILPVKE